MKQVFWMRYLAFVLVFNPLMPVSSIKAIAAAPIYLAQATAYSRYMQLGYDATRQRNYSVALTYFQQALLQRSGDPYATVAVRNLKGYIARNRQARARLAYIAASTGIPSRRIPGASRGGCIAPPNDKPTLTALVPETGAQLTTAGYPTFFFYIPQIPAQALELALSDEHDEELYTVTFKPTSKPGIFGFSLPTNSMRPLEIGKRYHWSFSLICDRSDRSGDLVVEGAIQRVKPDPNLTAQLEKAQQGERAALYATAGFWQDTLATLAYLRRLNPSDSGLRSDWEDLLRSQGLQTIAQEPLIQCCTVQIK